MKDLDAKEFIRKLIGMGETRPSATELLQSDFMKITERDKEQILVDNPNDVINCNSEVINRHKKE